MRNVRIAVALLAALLVPSVARAQDTAHGKALFLAYNCYQCHGTVGQGGAGPTIAPPKLMPTLGAFTAWLRHPGSGVMPVYTAAVMPDADVAAVYAYLRSQPAPNAVPALLGTLNGR